MRVVLGHELAHVKRNDWLIQIIAGKRPVQFTGSIRCSGSHVYNFAGESEHACDDAAMNLGGQLGIDGPTYAGHVLDLARTLKTCGTTRPPQLWPWPSTSNLERRLIAMLNPSFKSQHRRQEHCNPRCVYLLSV